MTRRSGVAPMTEVVTRYDVLFLVGGFGLLVLGLSVASLAGKVEQLRRELKQRGVL